MGQIDQELQKFLSYLSKQDQLEIKIIKRLHQLDTSNILHSDFHSVLENCKNT